MAQPNQGDPMVREMKSAAGVLALAASLVSFAVLSADHAESPGADADPAADLADVFLFHSPESASKLVAAITFGGRSAPRSRIDGSFYCDPDVLYTLNIDRADSLGNFDSIPDLQIYARFGKNSSRPMRPAAGERSRRRRQALRADRAGLLHDERHPRVRRAAQRPFLLRRRRPHRVAEHVRGAWPERRPGRRFPARRQPAPP